MFFNFLLPNKLVARYASDYSGTIEVRTEFGHPRVVVAKVPQSGGIVQDILKIGLDEFTNPLNFLLLGLGGGAILHEVRQRWRECKITAVEIDPVMIKVANKYFKMNRIENLEIVNQDAAEFVFNKANERMSNKTPAPQSIRNTAEEQWNNEIITIQRYDAVLVDCYLGDQPPKELESETFLKNLRSLLSAGGKIAFNRIDSPKVSFIQTQKLVEKLKKMFTEVKNKKVYSNSIIIVK
jgi:cyclopropane fatty-acyl-phospholipid synthase-like methyltransferase